MLDEGEGKNGKDKELQMGFIYLGLTGRASLFTL